MEKENLDIIKSLILENWAYIVIVILCFFLFRSCSGSEKLQIANGDLKLEVKDLVISADKYVNKINALNDKIVLLEIQKQKVKTEIVYIENKTKSDTEKVKTYSTARIADYYKDRYKLPIVITKYGVSLSDTLARKNIGELIQKDGCFAEMKFVRKELDIEEKKGLIKDTIIGNMTQSNILLHKAIFNQSQIIDNTEKTFKKERNKKTFWQVASGAVLLGAGYLLIVK